MSKKQEILKKLLTIICAITYTEDIKVILNYIEYLSFEDKAKYSAIIQSYDDQKINFKELQYKIIEALIQDKVDLNQNIEFLFKNKQVIIKPLYAVCIAKKDAKLAELMLNNGANINVIGKQLPIIFELANFIENTHNIVEKAKLIEVFKVIITSDKFNIHEEKFIIKYDIINTKAVDRCDQIGYASFFQVIIAFKNTDIVKILLDNNKIDLNVKIAGYDLISYVNEILKHSDDPKDEELIDLFENFISLEEQKISNEITSFNQEMKEQFHSYLTLNIKEESTVETNQKNDANLTGETYSDIWQPD